MKKIIVWDTSARVTTACIPDEVDPHAPGWLDDFLQLDHVWIECDDHDFVIDVDEDSDCSA